MNDTPLLKTPGEMIGEARVAQGLTLAQLSERTKIPPPVLAALELDEYHKISGPLYIKSFLRTCAMDLDLDPETVLGLYNKISGEKKKGSPGSETVWGEDDVQVSRIGLPWLKIILAVGVAAVVVGLGLFALRGCGTAEVDHENEVVVLEDQGVTVVPTEAEEGSLIPAETLEVLRDRAASDSLLAVSDTQGESVSAPPDTLALGWILNPELSEVAREVPDRSDSEIDVAPMVVSEQAVETARVQEPATDPEMDPEQVENQEQDPVQESPQETVPEPAPEPEAVTRPVAEPPVVISGPTGGGAEASPEVVDRRDSSWPLVLSIACPSSQNIQVKRDGDRAFSEVRWPGEGEPVPGVPAAGFEAGRAYRQDDRWVVFWGADDHFNIILARVSGVTVSLNGRAHDISRLKSGQELHLDADSLGSRTDR